MDFHHDHLNLVDRFLDGIKAVHERRIRLREGDVQQLPVVAFVLNEFEVLTGRQEEGAKVVICTE